MNLVRLRDLIGAVAAELTNCTSLTPLIRFGINAVLFVRLPITPPVGDVMAVAATPAVAPSVTVTDELKLNEPNPLMFGFVNGPDAKSQKPFCCVVPGAACGPANTVIVELNGASKPPTVSAVTVNVNGVPTATPAPATLQIFKGTGLNAILTNSTSATSLMTGTVTVLVEAAPVLRPLVNGKKATPGARVTGAVMPDDDVILETLTSLPPILVGPFSVTVASESTTNVPGTT